MAPRTPTRRGHAAGRREVGVAVLQAEDDCRGVGNDLDDDLDDLDDELDDLDDFEF